MGEASMMGEAVAARAVRQVDQARQAVRYARSIVASSSSRHYWRFVSAWCVSVRRRGFAARLSWRRG